jgi:hypothetical protein
MAIKVLYKEISTCFQCPYCVGKTHVPFCSNNDRGPRTTVSDIGVPSDCPLPDFRLDTEDDSFE